MELEAVRIQNFRSIRDTRWFEVGKLVALVGVNEAGKTSVLEALASLANADAFNLATDFPRDSDDLPSDDTTIVSTRFALDDDDCRVLAEAGYEVLRPAVLTFSKEWDGTRRLDVPGANARKTRVLVQSECDSVNENLVKLRSAIRKYVEKWPQSAKRDKLIVELKKRRPQEPTAAEFEKYVRSQLSRIRDAIDLSELRDNRQAQLEGRVKDIELSLPATYRDEPPPQSVVEVLWPRIPQFRYFADFGEVEGIVSLSRYVQLLDDPKKATPAGTLEVVDETQKLNTIQSLFALLGIEARQILEMDASGRTIYEGRISRAAKRLICTGWVHDIEIRVKFDGDQALVLVADVRDGSTSAPTELRQRSRGFRTFFSFFVNCGTIVAGEDSNVILLLDEPGLHLHGDQQHQFMKILRALSSLNTVMYTSHSPWMLPEDALNSIKAVEFAPDVGSTVDGRWWTKDSDTARAIRVRIGISQSTSPAFPGVGAVVAVEGTTDHLYLQSMLEAVKRTDSEFANKLKLEFRVAGGGPNLPTAVAMAKSEGSNHVAMLVDTDGAGHRAALDVVDKRILQQDQVVHTSTVLGDPNRESEIEDLLPSETLLGVVNAYLSDEYGVRRRHFITKEELAAARADARTHRVWPVIKSLASTRTPKGKTIDKTHVANHFAKMVSKGWKPSKSATTRFKRVLTALAKAAGFEPDG